MLGMFKEEKGGHCSWRRVNKGESERRCDLRSNEFELTNHIRLLTIIKNLDYT